MSLADEPHLAWASADIFYTDAFMEEVMGIEALPRFLYQYTSVESLEKILGSGTLRFSRLDKVNDPEEARAADVPLAASSVFVSCWSDSEAESIPMWSMYGRDFSGVRYRMPANMFAGRQNPVVFEQGGAITNVDGEWTITRPPPAASSMSRAVIGPNKVFYSDAPQFRERTLVRTELGRAEYRPYDLGMVKGKHWHYENEWRFKTSVLPFAVPFPDDRYFREITLDLVKYPVLEEAVFVPLDKSAFADIEIVVGPKADSGVWDAANALIKKYAPGGAVISSTVSIS